MINKIVQHSFNVYYTDTNKYINDKSLLLILNNLNYSLNIYPTKQIPP